jgi:hypothetical protein
MLPVATRRAHRWSATSNRTARDDIRSLAAVMGGDDPLSTFADTPGSARGGCNSSSDCSRLASQVVNRVSAAGRSAAVVHREGLLALQTFWTLCSAVVPTKLMLACLTFRCAARGSRDPNRSAADLTCRTVGGSGALQAKPHARASSGDARGRRIVGVETADFADAGLRAAGDWTGVEAGGSAIASDPCVRRARDGAATASEGEREKQIRGARGPTSFEIHDGDSGSFRSSRLTKRRQAVVSCFSISPASVAADPPDAIAPH